MNATTPVLVAYDGSDDADLALAWAATEAARSSHPLRILHVEEIPRAPWDASGLRPSRAELKHRAELVLAQTGHAGALEYCTGNVVGQLLEQAESAELLVVGSHGHGRTGEVFLGSVSQHLVRHAACTVVVVRRPRSADARRIIVGVDGSAGSSRALEYACRRAELTGEVVVAVHAWRDPAVSSEVWSATAREVEGLEERRRLLAESVAGVRADHPDVALEQEVIPVAPARCLADASARASLVVLGSRGLGFFSGLLLGSVSQAVLHRAECPVAVVR